MRMVYSTRWRWSGLFFLVYVMAFAACLAREQTSRTLYRFAENAAGGRQTTLKLVTPEKISIIVRFTETGPDQISPDDNTKAANLQTYLFGGDKSDSEKKQQLYGKIKKLLYGPSSREDKSARWKDADWQALLSFLANRDAQEIKAAWQTEFGFDLEFVNINGIIDKWVQDKKIDNEGLRSSSRFFFSTDDSSLSVIQQLISRLKQENISRQLWAALIIDKHYHPPALARQDFVQLISAKFSQDTVIKAEILAQLPPAPSVTAKSDSSRSRSFPVTLWAFRDILLAALVVLNILLTAFGVYRMGRLRRGLRQIYHDFHEYGKKIERLESRLLALPQGQAVESREAEQIEQPRGQVEKRPEAEKPPGVTSKRFGNLQLDEPRNRVSKKAFSICERIYPHLQGVLFPDDPIAQELVNLFNKLYRDLNDYQDDLEAKSLKKLIDNKILIFVDAVDDKLSKLKRDAEYSTFVESFNRVFNGFLNEILAPFGMEQMMIQEKEDKFKEHEHIVYNSIVHNSYPKDTIVEVNKRGFIDKKNLFKQFLDTAGIYRKASVTISIGQV